jgi:hypothetical protein
MAKQGFALGLLQLILACTSMQPIQPQKFIPVHQPDLVSVWTARDDVTIVSNPQIAGDTLTGIVFDAPWAVPLKDVLRVEARVSNGHRTALLVAGSAVSAAGMFLLLNTTRGNSDAPPCGPDMGCDGVETAPP